ncbi:MAG TPA: TonB-dependent receptor [Cellvibrio sp.]|nr:TonB-dependent receptor [Cellvibrio sp.]
MKFICLMGSLIASAFLSASTFAQQFSQDELFNFSLEELMDIRITSSTLTEKNIRTVPSSITIFTRQQIETLGVDSLEELLNYVPGFQSFRQADAGNEYYHSARGRRTGTTSREVLVLIDGQRLNQTYNAAPGMPLIALNDLEKVEIIRGPGSSIYGSNAFTGVINITRLRDKNALELQVGSHNHRQAAVFFGETYDDVSVNAYANFLRDRGEGYTLEKPSTFQRYYVRDPLEGYDVDVNVELNNTRLDIMHSNQWANDFYVVERLSEGYNERGHEYSSIQLQQSLNGDAIDTSAKLRYCNWLGHMLVPIDSRKTSVFFDEQSLEFNIYNDWKISQTQSLQFGLEQRYVRNGRTEQESSLGAILLNDAVSYDISGVYVQHQNKFSEDTELTLGGRFDHYASISSAFSPRLGLVHQLTNVQTIKLLYGHAFRAPGTAELELKENAVIVGNPELRPETIATTELVWMANWKNQTVTITGFNSRVKNSILQGFNGARRQYLNAAGVEVSQGIEIESLLQFSMQWQLRAQYSLFNQLPESAFRQADNLAAIILNYQSNHWNVNIAANHAGERQMLAGASRIQLNDYWLLNSKLQYVFAGEKKIYLQAKNLANQAYFTPPQGRAFSAGIPNRGRELSLGLEWDFQ